MDPSSISYMQHLTPYAYKFVAKQMALKTKVQLVNDSSEQFHVTSSEGSISVSSSTCQCTSLQSMKLPCRHILAVRTSLGLDLFDQALCDRRWSMDYYRLSQRVFLANVDGSTTQVSVVNLPTSKKKPLSQVR